MEFQQFNQILVGHVARTTNSEQYLFVTDVTPDALWEVYLSSYPAGTNEIFRERREHDCSCCRQFIRAIGNVVAIKDNELVSIWDFEVGDPTYQTVVDALSAFVKAAPVKDVFVTPTRKFGTEKNVEVKDAQTFTWYHFNTEFDSVRVTQVAFAVNSFDRGTQTKLYAEPCARSKASHVLTASPN